MNKIYDEVKLEVLILRKEDVITMSTNEFDDVHEDIFTPLDGIFGN